ncbi:MAG: AraC family transcriptional regulator [Cyclobacteriaceae bacterium]|nr:AraC family transcriptional regulator [Cyclobacteriaceae bacterium]
MENTIHIKNMVCPRCIESVREIFLDLKIQTSSIQLGEVILTETMDSNSKIELEEKLKSNGFELIKTHNSVLIGQIKTIIIEYIHYQNNSSKYNLSTLISEKLNHEYSSLSKLFSSVEGITIERFTLKQKVERIKELIFYNEFTLSEIALKMNYSSVAHLSSQFKKETGMTPTEFKKLRKPDRRSLDSI